MSLMDWDTCPEDIEEDQELIQAVEALVETAAVSVRTVVMDDVDTFLLQCKNVLEFLFPLLIAYRKDQSLIQEDLHKLLICICLFVLTFRILAPSQSQQHRHNYNARQQRRGSGGGWFTSNTTSAGRDELGGSLHLPSRSRGEQSDQDSESASNSRGFIIGEDETDEERFEKIWSSVAVDKYRFLVLPPSCKLVEKPRRKEVKRDAVLQKAMRDFDGTVIATAATSAASTLEKNDSGDDDDDNPAQRLHTYGQQLLYFIRSILSFDYAGAGWTLILWMQGIQRYQRKRSGSSVDLDVDAVVDVDAEDNDDDTASKVSPQANSLPSSPRPTATGLLSPFATPINEAENDGEDEGTVYTRRANVALSPLEEEKLESSLPENFPRLLKATLKMERMSNVYHDMPTDPGDGELGTFRTPNLQQRRSLKEKDELDSYRSAHERTLADSPVNLFSSTPQLPAEDVEGAGPVSRGLESRQSAFYFEAANSNDSLKKMSVEIPVPDKNGYILGDEHLPNSRYTPLLVFVNSRAGPQQGHLLITQLCRLLNPIQIWDLATGGPETVLESFCVLTRLRILVCGGDGTVSWIISALEKMNLKRKWPPIAILPLGTGNDLARIHGWGGGYNNESLITILEQIAESYISLLDRWEMTIEDSKGKVKEVKSFFNYLGVGADAQAALQVHYLRESRPAWFFSRLVNKAWYGIFGAEDIVKATSVTVRKDITLFADGVEIPLPLDSQGIIVLNIDSYAGGVPLWSHGFKSDTPMPGRGTRGPYRRAKSMSDFRMKRSHSFERVDSVDDMDTLLSDAEKFEQVTACEFPSSCQDGVLEVVSIRGAFHLGQIKVGLSTAQKVCQCREAKIVIKKKVAVQIDGEPWRQNSCTLRVKRKPDPAVMLHRSADDGGVETEMSKLLDWAEERHLIDGQVHSVLMKEFSRRIESKTRQRRVRNQDNIMYTLKRAIGSTGAMSNMQGAQQWPNGISF
jgi:diacylglycerol kinase (ATP)